MGLRRERGELATPPTGFFFMSRSLLALALSFDTAMRTVSELVGEINR